MGNAGSGTDFDDVKVKGIDGSNNDQLIRAFLDGSDYLLGILSKIKGNTDGTKIGNVNDAMKTYVTNIEPVGVDITGDYRVDAFGRLRMSNPVTLFESGFRKGLQPVYWDTKTTGSASVTHDANSVSAKLATTTASGDKAILQTYRKMHYNRGKSHSFIITGNFDGGQANVRKRIGYFDEENGTFLELDGTTLYAVIRSKVTGSVVDTRVAQSSFNTDVLDGSSSDDNPSGETFDSTKQQLLFCDFQWLGSGRVRWALAGANTGKLTYFHEFLNASVLTTPYSQSGDLPLRMEIENTGTPASADEMFITCSTVFSDGGDIALGPIWGFSSEGVEVDITTTETAIAAVRLKSAYAKYSAQPLSASYIMTSGNTSMLIRAYYRPSVTATWTSVNSESLCEYAIGTAITAFSGGYMNLPDYVATGGNKSGIMGANLKSDIFLGADIDQNQDVILWTGEMISGNGKLLPSYVMREFE